MRFRKNNFFCPDFKLFLLNTLFLIQQLVYTEDTLVNSLKERDKAAFTYLYNNYKKALYAVILQLIPDEEIASDTLQEAFITIWRNIDKYDSSKGRLFTWLVIIVRNTAINQMRSKFFRQVQKNDSLSLYVSYIEDRIPGEDVPVNHIGLRKQVHNLRPEYRDVLELGYFNGLTQEEISKVLKIPIGTVKTRLRNAVIELRKNFS